MPNGIPVEISLYQTIFRNCIKNQLKIGFKILFYFANNCVGGNNTHAGNSLVYRSAASGRKPCRCNLGQQQSAAPLPQRTHTKTLACSLRCYCTINISTVLIYSYQRNYGPDCLIGSATVISRWGSGTTSGARLGARLFKAVAVIISRKRSLLCLSFLVIQIFRNRSVIGTGC